MAAALDKFFQAIPRDDRYHLELRTNLYLQEPVFEVLDKHGVGQILSHWIWLPPLRKQLAKAGGNSPPLAQLIAGKFLQELPQPPSPKGS